MYPTSRLNTVLTQAWEREYYQQHWLMNLNEALSLLNSQQYHAIPIIRKRDISNNWDTLIEYGDFTDAVSSSGTTGRPVDLPVHRLQEQIWVDCVSRVFNELGAVPGDRLLQLLSNNDMFTLGPLVWQAAKKTGVGTFRCSPQRTKRILEVIQYHQPKFVAGNPNIMLNIAEELGDDFPAPEQLPDYAYFGAGVAFDGNNEPTPVAKKVMQLWGLKDALNEYGCSELGSVGHECRCHNGFHINDDAVFVELIDPSSGLPVKEGEPGEIVVTSLTLPRGFIAIRYGTGDISAWMDYEPCECGRRTPRIGGIIGRVDHQLKVLGQTVFPDLIFNVVDTMDNIEVSLIVKYADDNDAEQVELWVAPTENPEKTIESIQKSLEQRLAVSPKIRHIDAATIKKLQKEKMAEGNGVKLPRLIGINNINAYIGLD
ncbi:MAG TPA: phenylacetate--CoA ligase family protein [Gammaproteobacteria bacterium]|nr:phenylacetate--CoA ligase family protein [Gammaproteobacteria bacterium]